MSHQLTRAVKKVAFLVTTVYLCFVVHRLYMGLHVIITAAQNEDHGARIAFTDIVTRNILFSFLRPDLMYHNPNIFIWHQGQMLALLISLHGVSSMLWVCGTKITKWVPCITGSVAFVWLLIYIPVSGLSPSHYIIRPFLLILMTGLGVLLGGLWVKWFGSFGSPSKELSPHA